MLSGVSAAAALKLNHSSPWPLDSMVVGRFAPSFSSLPTISQFR